MMSRFWWDLKEKIHKIAWLNWKGLGRSRATGGLAFRVQRT